MGETANKAIMAEKISKDIFQPLGWKVVPPKNLDWPCVTPAHQSDKTKGTHPTDVVFSYEDPYSDLTVFINTDLKSYGSDSITKYALSGALNSLAKATDCTRRSIVWQERHIPEGIYSTTVGMLFVYNHDNQYNSDFSEALRGLDPKAIDVAPDLKIFAFGPEDVLHMLNLITDMRNLHFEGVIPNPSECRFFYPHLIRKRARIQQSPALSIEAIASPWQVYTYQKNKPGAPSKGRVIFGRGKGETVDEFKYMFDYLFRFQLIDLDSEIQIRLPNAAPNAASICKSAVDSYAFGLPMGLHVHELLSKITCEQPNRVVAKYSEVQIGMSDD